MSIKNASSDSFSKMHIHRMRVPKKVSSLDNLKAFLVRVVKEFNDPKVKEGNKEHTFQPIPSLRWKSEEHHGFDALAYYSRRPGLQDFGRFIASMSSIGRSELTSYTVHHVFFLFRKVSTGPASSGTDVKVAEVFEAFALTTFEGGQVVKKKVEYGFPIRLAKVLMQPALTRRDTKSLAGNKDSTTENYRLQFDLKKYELESIWLVFKGFSTSFSPNCSLYNPTYGVSAFLEHTNTNKNEPVQKAQISVSVGTGQIKVGKKMTMKQHEELLLHFSRVAREETTLTAEKKPNEEVESSEFAYLENIQTVEYAEKVKLDCLLVSCLHQLYVGKQPGCDLYFVHRHYNDFYRSMQFEMVYKGRKLIWYYRPSMEDILFALRTFTGKMDLKAFSDMLGSCKIRFDARTELFPLSEFFHGEVRFQNSVYFRVDNLWLRVIPEHIVVIQRAFHVLLDDLIVPTFNAKKALTNQHGQLHIPWFAKTDWVAFELTQAPKTVDQEKLVKVVRELIDTHFQFVDEEGKVLCPYLTRCLLVGHDYGKSFTDSIKKKWEQINDLLAEKAKKEQKLTEEDLVALFMPKKAAAKKSQKKQTDEDSTPESENKDEKDAKEKAKKLMVLLKRDNQIIVPRKKAMVEKATVVAEEGTVVRFSLEGVDFGGNKTLEKMGPYVEEYLEEKHASQTPATQEDFVEVLSQRKDDHNKHASNKSRYESENYLTKVYEALKKAGVIRKDGSVTDTSVAEVSLLKKSTRKVRKVVRAYLQAHNDEKAITSEKDFVAKVSKDLKSLGVEKIDRVGKTNLESAFSALQKPQKVNREQVYGRSYVVQGPLPEDLDIDQAIVDFLTEQHENYRLVVQEEGYNRMYLSKKGYIVCDQVYSSKRESGELFDVAYDDEEDETLYLYHVKESVGQKTSEACAQILSAAVSLRGSIDDTSFAAVRKLYDRAVSGDSSMPFRKKLKETMERLPLPEGATLASDRLVELFKRDRSKICFVYAFIDDAETERFLIDEKSPAHAFIVDDFDGINGKEKVVAHLKKPAENKCYLDEKGKISADFLREKKEDFIKIMKNCDKNIDWEKVYSNLVSHVSQFDSMRAKLELLQLQKFIVDELGFGFKICQIPRSPAGYHQDSVVRNPTVSAETWGYAEELAKSNIKYEEMQFAKLSISLEVERVFNLIGKWGYDDIFSLRFKLLELLRNYCEQHSFAKLASAFGFKSPKKETGKEIPETFVLEFLNGKFADHLLDFFAKLLGYKFIIFSTKEEFEATVNDEGKEVYLLKRNGEKFDVYEGGDTAITFEDESSESSSSVGSDIESSELASNEATFLTTTANSLVQNAPKLVRMSNNGNDCFFNALFQLLMRSPFRTLLLSLFDGVWLEEEEYKSFMARLIIQFYLPTDSPHQVNYPRKKMRKLFGFAGGELYRQQDAAECFSRMIANYNCEDEDPPFCSSQMSRQGSFKDATRFSNSSQSQVASKRKGTHRFEEKEELKPMIEVAMSEEELSFKKLVSQTFWPMEMGDSKNQWKSDVGETEYTFSNWIEQTNINYHGKLLLIQLKRFIFDEQTMTKEKNEAVVQFSSLDTIHIEGVDYQITGFVEHIGDAGGGHYVSYSLIDGEWHRFDDANEPEIISKKVIVDCAGRGYIFMLERKDETD